MHNVTFKWMRGFNLNNNYIYNLNKERNAEKLIIVDFYGEFENKIKGACESLINTNYVLISFVDMAFI